MVLEEGELVSFRDLCWSKGSKATHDSVDGFTPMYALATLDEYSGFKKKGHVIGGECGGVGKWIRSKEGGKYDQCTLYEIVKDN